MSILFRVENGKNTQNSAKTHPGPQKWNFSVFTQRQWKLFFAHFWEFSLPMRVFRVVPRVENAKYTQNLRKLHSGPPKRHFAAEGKAKSVKTFFLGAPNKKSWRARFFWARRKFNKPRKLTRVTQS